MHPACNNLIPSWTLSCILAGAQLAEELGKCAKRARFGDGFEDGVEFGPLNNKMQFDRVASLVKEAIDAGASVVTGGAPMAREGYFFAPTIVKDVKEGLPLVDEEQFGPALPICTYREDDEAVSRANATHFGLGASVWSKDVHAANAMAGRLRAGTGTSPRVCVCVLAGRAELSERHSTTCSYMSGMTPGHSVGQQPHGADLGALWWLWLEWHRTRAGTRGYQCLHRVTDPAVGQMRLFRHAHPAAVADTITETTLRASGVARLRCHRNTRTLPLLRG